MSDLQNPRLIWLKGWLFLLMAIVSFLLLALELRSQKFVLVLTICVWSACRFYYFAFYVIQHYVDDSFRFRGLLHFLQHVVQKNEKEE